MVQLPTRINVTGMGVLTAIAQTIPDFTQALFEQKTAFGYLKRPGREGAEPFLGAELPDLDIQSKLPEHRGLLRTASWSSQVATLALSEAWQDAKLETAISSGIVNPERIGLVVGGSNFQQRSQQELWQKYQSKPQFIRPTYGLTVWDTDMVGILSQCFPIRGEGYTVGCASASGALAIIHAARQILTGETDVSIAVGALFDLSSWECQGLRNLGAMGSDKFSDRPELACRPFDQDHDGFIYGEGCGVLVLERANLREITAEEIASADPPKSPLERGTFTTAPLSKGWGDLDNCCKVHGTLLGWGLALDGNRATDPSQAGEERAMQAALTMANLQPEQIDYVNTHGTSSPLGDRTEAAALKGVGLSHALVNSTKSLTGHCLTGAGVVEAIATLLQLKAQRCHGTHNLIHPIDPNLNWVTEAAIPAEIKYAISNSFAFGGMNAAIVFGHKEVK
ncbi:beta-ketoacyl synthase N-terminal-like domain-containing protein [Roseofilum capinflatum]|uniref:Beta-ketoacyl synthase N-terminal-like domain-containing protein n=1 Tax=Roseofilum capinflatum BLCC-M114 TaxID=3022440 RepID=A0ABT7B8M0_9CYAN|nr:beta-ketoacyl synthase N-terminal-like domain-containing protein [Roseofilum capinflatum]MDJ1175529.1 beta-ketoacyl synthase N-terminal-like domain-containing protein [Roseofilum capinflatum BLCC-M114]